MKTLTGYVPLNELVFSILRKRPNITDAKLIEKVYELRLSKSGRNLHYKEFLQRIDKGKIDSFESIKRYSRTYRKNNSIK